MSSTTTQVLQHPNMEKPSCQAATHSTTPPPHHHHSTQCDHCVPLYVSGILMIMQHCTSFYTPPRTIWYNIAVGPCSTHTSDQRQADHEQKQLLHKYNAENTSIGSEPLCGHRQQAPTQPKKVTPAQRWVLTLCLSISCTHHLQPRTRDTWQLPPCLR